VAMKPDTTVYAGGLAGKNKVYILAETGKQYAIYWMGGKQVRLELNLPKGNYSLEWMNPLSGKTEKKIELNHAGGKAKLISPEYSKDFSLRILKVRN